MVVMVTACIATKMAKTGYCQIVSNKPILIIETNGFLHINKKDYIYKMLEPKFRILCLKILKIGPKKLIGPATPIMGKNFKLVVGTPNLSML